MSESQTENTSSVNHRGVACAVSPANVEKCWPSVAQLLKLMEGWTQSVSASDIRQGIAAETMHLWSVIDHADVVSIAITIISASGRGIHCKLLLMASPLADDASITSLVDEGESWARQQNCSVLEIVALPAWADRLKGKLTSIVIERDLRSSRRAN